MQSGELWRRPEALVLGRGAGPICVHLEGLSAGQRRLCQLYPDHMASVARGVRAGIAECQYQLHGHRWNCSTVNDSSVFGSILSAGKYSPTCTDRSVSKSNQNQIKCGFNTGCQTATLHNKTG